MIPEPFPNIKPNPTSQKAGVPIQKSIRFFIKIFPVFFALVNPASHMENPACIKKTKAAPNNTYIVFTELYMITTPPTFSIYFTLNSRSPYVGNGQYFFAVTVSASSQTILSSCILVNTVSLSSQACSSISSAS